MKNTNFWKSSLMILLFCFGLTSLWGQTNPTPHNLGDSNFTMMSVPSGTSYPTSTQGWTIGATNSYLTTASTAAPSDNKLLINSDNGSTYGMFNRTTNGIGFRQSNSNRNVGAFVVAINTIGVSNVEVQYFLTAAYPTDRIAGIQAQYRIGTTGDFINLGTTKESDNFSEIAYIETLPESCEDQEVIQVRWVYFDIGTSGGRTGVSIDDITISSTPSDPTQVATPTISATGTANGIDTYWDSAEITLETTTPDATIYYTVNNGDLEEYSTPFAITSTSTIEAYAEADGLDDSEVATKTITITYTVPTITASTESITALGYEFDSPTSTAQSFNLTGANLDGTESVMLFLDEDTNSDFEMSLDNVAYSTDLTIENFGNGSTPVYVRLKSGLAISEEYLDMITILNGYNSDELNILVEGAVTPPAPTTTVSETALSGFTYVLDNGPSSEQSFTVEGSYLTSDITVTAPTNYQVSLSSGSGFQNSVTLTQTDGTVAETTVYVQLNAGLGVNNYNGDITISATGVANKTIALTGSVTCGASALPYSEDFESVTTPNVPNCTTVVQGGSGNLWTTSSPNESGFTSKALTYQWNTTNDADTWFFTNGLELEGGQSYRLSFRYGNNSTSYSESLRVAYGTSNSIAAMTTELADYPNINDNTPHSVTINFEPATTGTYYIGFQAYSEPDNYRLYVDDILVEENVPTISVEPVTVPAFTAVTDGSDSENIIITGILLSDNIDIALSGINADQFSLSATSLDSAGGTLTVTYEPTTVGNHTATLTLSSTDATDVVLTLNGIATIGVPVATDATAIGSDSFTANWNAVAGAESYEIDVYTVEGTPAPELVVNGDFETGTTNSWSFDTGMNQAINEDIKYAGLYSLYTTVSATRNMNQVIPVESEEEYTLGFWYYIDESSTGNGFRVWTTVGTTITPSTYLSTKGSWEYAEYNFTTTSNSLTLNFRLYNGIKLYLDNISVKLAGQTSTTIYTLEAENVGNVTSYEVTGLDPATTYYYVVRAVAGAETSANSNEIEVETAALPEGVIWTLDNEWLNENDPSIEEDVTIAGTLYVGADTPSFEAKTLTVLEGGALYIQEGYSVTVAGLIDNQSTAGSFTVNSGGNLIQNTDYTGANTGEITVQRNSQDIVRLDYTLWSSPVNGQNLKAFSPATLWNRIFTYETNSTDFGDHAYVQVFNADTAPDIPFASGKGYLFRAPNNWAFPADAPIGAPYEGSFVGVPNNGDITISTFANGFTSVGNPYPSNIDPEALLDANSSIGTIYFWNNPERVFDEGTETWGYTGNRYITFTGAGYSNGDYDGNSISVGQGFIAYSTGSSITFDNSIRVDTEENFFKTEDTEKHRFWLNLTNDAGQSYNQTLTAYMSGATQGVDQQIDGKFFGYEGSALYSIIEEGAYAIQGRALPFEVSDVVPLGFKAAEAGKFKVSLANFDGLFAEGAVTIYLKDNQLDIIHNLMESDYEFESVQGTFKERFEVVYETEETMGTGDMDANLVQIYQNNQEIVVSSKAEKILSVELFDLQGRKIHSNAKVNANLYQIQSAPFGTQVLVVKVQTANGVTTTKKVINK